MKTTTVLAIALGIKATWMGKHTLFRPPLGWLMRALGGLPIDRTARHNVVEQAIAKRRAKGCDWIVANDVSGDVMGGHRNRVHLITEDGVEDCRPRHYA